VAEEGEADGNEDPGSTDDGDVSWADFLDEHGYLAWLGVRVDDAGDGWAIMRIPYDEKLLNPGTGGTVHGGVAATLIDTSSAFALRTTFEDPMEAGMATTDLHVSYLRPARDDLVAHAEVVRAGGSIGVTDVVVESTTPDGEVKEVAVGRTTYRLFR
jgi:uncharacterized protein (TIGR00369 family)